MTFWFIKTYSIMDDTFFNNFISNFSYVSSHILSFCHAMVKVHYLIESVIILIQRSIATNYIAWRVLDFHKIYF